MPQAAETVSIEARVQRLEDERAILEMLYLYGHTIDYILEQDFLDCWIEDGELVWPADPPFVGHEAIAGAFRRTTGMGLRHKHFVAAPLIRLDGDRAEVDSYFSRLLLTDDGSKVASFGRYRDVLVRCDDRRWRFAKRVTERQP
jgi:hypothetical protein